MILYLMTKLLSITHEISLNQQEEENKARKMVVYAQEQGRERTVGLPFFCFSFVFFFVVVVYNVGAIAA